LGGFGVWTEGREREERVEESESSFGLLQGTMYSSSVPYTMHARAKEGCKASFSRVINQQQHHNIHKYKFIQPRKECLPDYTFFYCC
jgi:hypothetical protein